MEAATELNKSVFELSTQELTKVYNEVGNRYIDEFKYPVWERFKDSLSVRDPNGWLSIKSLIEGKPVIMFLEPNSEKFGISLEDGEDLVDILDAIGYLIFYITNPEYDFLLAYNDHDYLIVTGEKAQKWMINTYDIIPT